MYNIGFYVWVRIYMWMDFIEELNDCFFLVDTYFGQGTLDTVKTHLNALESKASYFFFYYLWLIILLGIFSVDAFCVYVYTNVWQTYCWGHCLFLIHRCHFWIDGTLANCCIFSNERWTGLLTIHVKKYTYIFYDIHTLIFAYTGNLNLRTPPLLIHP